MSVSIYLFFWSHSVSPKIFSLLARALFLSAVINSRAPRSSRHSICRLPFKHPVFNSTSHLPSLLCLVSLSSEPQHSVFLIISCRWFLGGRSHLALWDRRTYPRVKHSVYRCSTNHSCFLVHVSLACSMVPLPSNSRPFWGFLGKLACFTLIFSLEGT